MHCACLQRCRHPNLIVSVVRRKPESSLLHSSLQGGFCPFLVSGASGFNIYPNRQNPPRLEPNQLDQKCLHNHIFHSIAFEKIPFSAGIQKESSPSLQHKPTAPRSLRSQFPCRFCRYLLVLCRRRVGRLEKPMLSQNRVEVHVKIILNGPH